MVGTVGYDQSTARNIGSFNGSINDLTLLSSAFSELDLFRLRVSLYSERQLRASLYSDRQRPGHEGQVSTFQFQNQLPLHTAYTINMPNMNVRHIGTLGYPISITVVQYER